MHRSAQTIPDALRACAAAEVGRFSFHLDEGVERVSSAELADRAETGARRLAALGVEPGDTVGLLGPNRPEWVVWAFATWLAGAVVVPIQIPLRVKDPDAFTEQIRNLVRTANCRRVLVDPRLTTVLSDDVAVPWDWDRDASGDAPAAPAPTDPAVIQFTSGSTASPRGALLTHTAVLAQMDILHRGYHRDGVEPRSTLSWTPFFHDLGLFANVVQVATWGLESHHLPTERFARDPVEWLRLIGTTRVDVTVAPSSAFGSAVRAARRRGEQVDLSSLDAAFFAAEGVDPEVAGRVMDEARLHFRFPPEALGSTYGLAEAVMAVAYPIIGSGMRVDRVDLAELTSARVAAPASGGPSRLMVSCGPPAPTMDIRIAGPGGEPLPERHVGQIMLRGRSLMTRYVGSDAPDPFVGDWLATGDMGYLADGDLFPTGRVKDMVIAMGHNYYPDDFEWAAARVDGVRPGRCVAFSQPDTEQLVLLVEPSSANGDPSALARDVRRKVKDVVGVAPAEVIVVPAGTVEKTTSGKLRRSAMRDAYATGALGR